MLFHSIFITNQTKMNTQQTIDHLTTKIREEFNLEDISPEEYNTRVVVPVLLELLQHKEEAVEHWKDYAEVLENTNAQDQDEIRALTGEVYLLEEELEIAPAVKKERISKARVVTNNHQINDFCWTQKISIEQDNPHKEGSIRASHYEITKSATTIAEYRALAKDAKIPRFYLNFKYDIQRDYITLVE